MSSQESPASPQCPSQHHSLWGEKKKTIGSWLAVKLQVRGGSAGRNQSHISCLHLQTLQSINKSRLMGISRRVQSDTVTDIQMGRKSNQWQPDDARRAEGHAG